MTQSRKKKTEALKASTAVVKMSKSDIAAGDAVLTSEQEKVLAGCAERIVALGRKSTVQAYEYGEELATVQAILPAKKFGSWLKVNSGISTKTAKYYTRVFKELSGYRDRFVKSAVAPTAMFALLGADDQSIETVLDALESGERLTVEKIKEMMGGAIKPEKPSLDPLNMPGRAGCMKIAEDRMKFHITLFYELLERVLIHVENAVANFAAGKRVIKSDLAIAIDLDCRHANELFGLTLAPLYICPTDPRFSWRSMDYDAACAWGRLQKALRYGGSEATWPVKDAFRPWIIDEVYPLLKFALRGEPLVGQPTSDAAAIDAEAIQAKEEAHDLKATRMYLDAPALQSNNVVELAERQQRKAAIKTIEA